MGLSKQCPTCSGSGVIEPPLGARIKTQRKLKGWTQAELAQKVGIARASLANMEANRQTVDPAKMIAFARILNVTSDYLLGLTEASDVTRV